MWFHDSSNFSHVSDWLNECHSLVNHPSTEYMYSKDSWIILFIFDILVWTKRCGFMTVVIYLMLRIGLMSATALLIIHRLFY